MVTSIYCSVNNVDPRVYTCLHWHIQHLSSAVFHPPHNMYICTHASTPGTTVRQQLCEKLMQMQEVLHAPSVQRTQSHLAPPTLGLRCTPSRDPNTPHPPLLSSQQTPEQFADRGQAQFYSLNTDFDSKSLCAQCTTLEKLCTASQWPLA